MYHELRTLRLKSPRLMQSMSDRLEHRMIPLFRAHSIRAIGAWETVVGRDMPTFTFMLEWDDLAHRERSFGAFYADPEVDRMLDETIRAAGTEFLRDFDVALCKPIVSALPSTGAEPGGYHELRTYRLHSPRLMGHMRARMENHMNPLFAEHGMRSLGGWEVVVGREMATFIYMLEWRDLAHRERGFGSFYGDPRVAEMTDATIAAAGSEFVRDFDVALLRPMPYLSFPGA